MSRKALSLSLNPMYKTLGDPRWTADMITGAWIMAETGYPPDRTDLEYNTGNSGAGSTSFGSNFPHNHEELISLNIHAIPLNVATTDDWIS